MAVHIPNKPTLDLVQLCVDAIDNPTIKVILKDENVDPYFPSFMGAEFSFRDLRVAYAYTVFGYHTVTIRRGKDVVFRGEYSYSGKPPEMERAEIVVDKRSSWERDISDLRIRIGKPDVSNGNNFKRNYLREERSC